MLALFGELHRQGAIGLASLPEYWRNHWGDLAAFVEAGGDGFEIVNCAPKALGFPAPARSRVLQLAAEHDLLVVGASDNHGWGEVTCVWNLSSPSAHGFRANRVVARPIALAQGDWESWTAAYTQPWLMLQSLSWSAGTRCRRRTWRRSSPAASSGWRRTAGTGWSSCRRPHMPPRSRRKRCAARAVR